MKDLVSLPARTREGVLVVVETPAGARVKLKLDPELGHISISRPLPLGLHYPFDWGFVPSTKAEDGDPLDAMLYGIGPGLAGAVVPARLLGVLKVEQNRKQGPGRERNDRLFLAPVTPGPAGEPADVLAFPSGFAPSSRISSSGPLGGSRRTCASSAGAASTRPKQSSPPL